MVDGPLWTCTFSIQSCPPQTKVHNNCLVKLSSLSVYDFRTTFRAMTLFSYLCWSTVLSCIFRALQLALSQSLKWPPPCIPKSLNPRCPLNQTSLNTQMMTDPTYQSGPLWRLIRLLCKVSHNFMDVSTVMNLHVPWMWMPAWSLTHLLLLSVQ
jgi:hypothetical protein